MSRKWFGTTALIVTAITLLSLSSCADPQELVSIQVQPTGETFGASNIPVSRMPGSRCNSGRSEHSSTRP